eukprot:CAMPEP_0202704974 /NCGR_PEP_ID=MMETSP1385-20130828/17570_1 /ASSEMBLY_ACC=CAM_ASM_000861 /TAXON_ID=933848 /ORGANISM="Elphidium margaritaceum" /LENGTH=699 /DNA_ID=CAMNT_0049363103 /DNA_START=163 /DNA_END=2262 /DNA_ORIENTATION=+
MNVKPKKAAATAGLQGRIRAQDPDGSGVFDNIRLHYDTSQLELDWASYAQKDYFVNDVVPAAQQWIQKAFMVRPVDGPLTFTAGTNTVCGNGESSVTIPDSMFDGQGSGLSDTDIVIYVRGNPALDSDIKCQDVMGFAAYCRTNSRSRPIAGYINLCRSTIQFRISSGVLTWEEVLTLLIHETFHVLGFSADGFANFVDDAGQPLGDSNVWQSVTRRGKTRTEIILPTVVEKAREFYGCSTLTGLEVEEFSGTGISSHWENRVVPYDVMISYVPLASPFSSFTLAVFADSGWYNINWEYAQQSPYGRNEGCEFFDDLCVTSQQSNFDDTFCGRDQIKSGSCKIPIGNSFCKGANGSYPVIPSSQQYFDSSQLGGDNVYPDYCPMFELYNNGDCREIYDGQSVQQTVDLTGGLIAQNSKCAAVESSINGLLTSCYPTECIKDVDGDYVATRLTMYRNYQRTLFDVLTCWADESGQAKSLGYIAQDDYKFDTFYCPDFERICYDENPWICNGHGTFYDGNCVCSPGYFGRDCSIAYTAANRAVYDDTDSLSVYDSVVCLADEDWTFTEDDVNVGVLSLSITLNAASTYVEDNIRTAIRNFVAIVTEISLCDVSVQSYVYDETAGTVTASVWYYTTLTTWTESSASVQSSTFFALKLGSAFDASETKIADGTHEDNVATANIRSVSVGFAVMMLFVLFVSFV